MKLENKIKEEKNKKPYIESYNKIEGKPKNIFVDEEIRDENPKISEIKLKN